MTIEFLNIVVYTQTTLSAFVAFFCLIKFKSRKHYVRLIGFVFLLSFVANTVAITLYNCGLGRLVNIPQSAYDIGAIVIITLVFYNALNKRYSRAFLIVALCFLVFSLLNLLFLQKSGINSYNKFLSSFIVTCYCVFYFYRLMVELPSIHLQRMPMFWFTSAFLIYHAGTIFLFAFTSYLTNVLKNDLITYWSFHNFLSIIEHLLMLVGVYYDRNTNRNTPDDLYRPPVDPPATVTFR
jgi:hypothetical protein